MSVLLERFKQREAQKTAGNPAKSEILQSVMQSNLIPAQQAPVTKAEETAIETTEDIPADQIMENESVILDGVIAVCKGRQSDGRIAFLKEGNSRNTLVNASTMVKVILSSGEYKPEEKPAEKPVINTYKAPVEEEQNHQVSIIPTNNAVALPFEGLITADIIKKLFEGNEVMIREALEEDVLPEGNFNWPEIVMKECTMANGQTEMLFALKHGKKQFSFPFKDGKNLKGIIIYQRCSKALYPKESKPGDGALPLCWSNDGIVPYGGEMFNRTCKGCPYDAFGTKGKGKICGDRVKIFLYVPELAEVYLFDTSPSSRTAVTNYLHNLTANNPPINYKNIYTNFTCKSVCDGNAPYGVIDTISPEMISDIEDFKIAIERRVALKDMMTPGTPAAFPENQHKEQAQVSNL